MKPYRPVTLDADEQIVFATDGRIWPSLSEIISMVAVLPALFLLSVLILHRLFRPVSYLITTKRLMAIEPHQVSDQILLKDIRKTNGSKTSLMVRGRTRNVWLSRLPDAWWFESIIWRVIESQNERGAG